MRPFPCPKVDSKAPEATEQDREGPEMADPDAPQTVPPDPGRTDSQTRPSTPAHSTHDGRLDLRAHHMLDGGPLPARSEEDAGHLSQGRLLARQSIDELLDPGTLGDGVITGRGEIDGCTASSSLVIPEVPASRAYGNCFLTCRRTSRRHPVRGLSTSRTDAARSCCFWCRSTTERRTTSERHRPACRRGRLPGEPGELGTERAPKPIREHIDGLR